MTEEQQLELGMFQRWSAMAARRVDKAVSMREADEREIRVRWCGDPGLWFIARRGSSAVAGVPGSIHYGFRRPLPLMKAFSDEGKARSGFENIRPIVHGSAALVDPTLNVVRYASQPTREALRELVNVILGFDLHLKGRPPLHLARVLTDMKERDSFVSQASFGTLRELVRLIADATPGKPAI